MSEIGKRVAAARAYAGIKSQTALGDALGLSQSTIQRIESGGRGLKDYETRTLLVAIAEVCGLPDAWFTADFSRLGELAPEDAKQLAGADAAAAAMTAAGLLPREHPSAQTSAPSDDPTEGEGHPAPRPAPPQRASSSDEPPRAAGGER